MAAWPKPSRPRPYDANWALSLKTAPYDASVAKCSLHRLPPIPNPNPANPVAGLRCQRGNWATKYDANAAMWQNTFRRHFGHSYDVNLARNTWVQIGGNQDELAGECRWAVKMLRQKAGLLLATDPRMAEVAREIRNRSQAVLRNPPNHESARH